MSFTSETSVSAWPAPIPAEPLRFPVVRDRLGPRLALVFGNHAPRGECPFYARSLCHHCDIGAGEGAPFDRATNRARLAWFRAHYASVLPEIAHLVVYNSGSVLNPVEMPADLLAEILGSFASLPRLRAVSLDSREIYVATAGVLEAARALGRGKTLRVSLGLESADDAIRDGLLEKRMPRAAVERALHALGRAAREAARDPACAAIGLDVNIVVGGPGAPGARAADDARATARHALDLARAGDLPVDLNLHPYYPSARGRARFPAHPRPTLAQVVEATAAVLDEIRRAGRMDAHVFLGLHDEGHDRDPSGRAREVAPLGLFVDRFHETEDPAALAPLLEHRRRG